MKGRQPWRITLQVYWADPVDAAFTAIIYNPYGNSIVLVLYDILKLTGNNHPLYLHAHTQFCIRVVEDIESSEVFTLIIYLSHVVICLLNTYRCLFVRLPFPLNYNKLKASSCPNGTRKVILVHEYSRNIAYHQILDRDWHGRQEREFDPLSEWTPKS
jgi:hypothetical protein